MTKEKIIADIQARIKAEYSKHSRVPELDWTLLAANKIYEETFYPAIKYEEIKASYKSPNDDLNMSRGITSW